MPYRQHWLVKQEPEAYSWDDFVRDGGTLWTGVRNHQAQIHLRAMLVGDRVLFYHSVSEKAVVGIAQVARTAFADPTAEDGNWQCVALSPIERLPVPVSLAAIRAHATLCKIGLVRQTRLSVVPLSPAEYRCIVDLSSVEKPSGPIQSRQSSILKQTPGTHPKA